MTTATPTIGGATTQVVPDGVANRIESLGEQIQSLATRQQELADLAGIAGKPEWSRMEIFQGYLAIGVVAFVITLLATPIIRRLAVANGVVDHPDERKMHRMPIAYLGGLAVYLGLMGAIFFSYIATDPRFGALITFHQTEHLFDGGFPRAVPPWIPLGITVIMLVGLLDDVGGSR